MKKLLSLFICFSLFISLPLSLFAKEGVDVSDEPIPFNEDSDISLNSASVGDSVQYQLFADGIRILTSYMTVGQEIGWSNSQVDELWVRLPVDYNEPSVNVSFSAQLNLDNIVYQSSTAQFGETASPGTLKVTTLNGTNVGTSGNCSVAGTIENNSSDSMPYIWFKLKFYVSNTSGDYSFTLNNVSFSLVQNQIDYSDILNTINSNILAMQGSMNNIFSYLTMIGQYIDQYFPFIEDIYNHFVEYANMISDYYSSIAGYLLSIDTKITDFKNSFIQYMTKLLQYLVIGDENTQDTVQNTDKTNQDLENVTNEHDQIEQEMTGDFNNAIADVDINQGTDFLTSMSASFTWVGTQMTNLFNYGGQIQYLLMYSLILGFALVLIGRGLK